MYEQLNILWVFVLSTVLYYKNWTHEGFVSSRRALYQMSQNFVHLGQHKMSPERHVEDILRFSFLLQLV